MDTLKVQEHASNETALPLRWRRAIFAVLVIGSMLTALIAVARLLFADGVSLLDGVILALFTVTLPWAMINFWNCLIGFLLLRLHPNPLKAINPLSDGVPEAAALRAPTAIIMPAYNEDPEQVFEHLRVIERGLATTGQAEAFELFMLSDTTDEAIAQREQELFIQWRAASRHPGRLHYRRRDNNAGKKTGNIWQWLRTHGDRFPHFIVLDADSVMSGRAIVRLAQIMEVNPQLGLLQQLAVGLPNTSPFPRILQFGMRQGLRTYTYGITWWQGPCGQYWGHNAIIRTQAFMQHAKLPQLPGNSPLSGQVLSHDQVEAVMLSQAGYEVRVLPVEEGSYELNPPSLPAFMKRDLRWCQGNLQYMKLIGLPGWGLMQRLQLTLAVLMYLSAPAWFGFIFAGLFQGLVLPDNGEGWWQTAPVGYGLALFGVMMVVSLSPKVFGFLDILTSRAKRQRYGGLRPVLKSAGLEFVFAFLLGPIIAWQVTMFVFSLLVLHKKIVWECQEREGRALSWAEGWTWLWPQTLLGLVLTLIVWWQAPPLLIWLSPLLLSLIVAIPLAVISSSPMLGRWMQRSRVCTVPEEIVAPQEIFWLERTPAQMQIDAARRPAPARALGAQQGAAVGGKLLR